MSICNITTYNQFMICSIFTVLGFGVSNQYAVAEDAYLWVPSEMIQGTAYEGVLVLENKNGGVFDINIEDSVGMATDISVTVLPGSNQGIFKISAKNDGNLTFHAYVEEKTVDAFSYVYSQGNNPHKLQIIIPANITKAESITGFIMVTDINGVPTSVKMDTEITMDSTGFVLVPDFVTVLSGNHYAEFDIQVNGNGLIFASARSLDHTEQKIIKQENKIEIKMAVAPAIAMKNSKVLLTIWFEKDGKPFKPSHVIDAWISSSNTNVARFEKFQGFTNNDVGLVTIIDGIGYKEISTYETGYAVITASVQGFGVAQTQLVVGSVNVDSVSKFLTDVISGSAPNIAVVWASPQTGTDEFTGVVALYMIEYSKRDAVLENFTDITPEIKPGGAIIEKITPIIPNKQTVLLSSAGLIHPNSVLMKGDIGHGYMPHSMKFDIIAKNVGEYEIFASGPDLEPSHTKIVSKSPYEETYELLMTSLPAFTDKKQPLVTICVVDSNGIMIDAQKMLGMNAVVMLYVDKTYEEVLFFEKSCAIWYGKIDDSMLVVASMQGIEPISQKIHPVQTALSVLFEAPKQGYAGEEMPFVVHKMGLFGVPIARIDPISITGDVLIKNQRIIVQDPGMKKMIALTEFGADEIQTEVFGNKIDFQVIPKSTFVRLGQNVSVVISSNTNALDIMVNSLVPATKSEDGVFVLTPNNEGVFPVIFTAKKDGRLPTVSEFVLTVKEIVELDVNAIGNDGKELFIKIKSSNDSQHKGLTTPQVLEIKPGPINFEFPTEYFIDGYNYVLADVIIDKKSIKYEEGIFELIVKKDDKLVLKYNKMVNVNVVGAEGSGIYPYGSKIVLFASDKYVYSFLIKEVFDSWSGIEGNTSTILLTATTNVVGDVVYKKDYWGLMIVMLVCVTIIALVVLTRKHFAFFKNKEKMSVSEEW